MRRFCKSAFVAVVIASALACKSTGDVEAASEVMDEDEEPVGPEGPAVPGAAISPPYASGLVEDVKWELRLNRPVCNHAPNPSTWCTDADRPAATAQSGIEPTLIAWANDPAVTSLKISYMTFSAGKVATALCDNAKSRSLKVDIFLQSDYVSPPAAATGVYKQLLDCSAAAPSLEVHARGTNGWLNHAKIFLALTSDGRTRFTSSSANLSSSGVSLHYDNWLVLDTPTENRLAGQNLCFFDALENMLTPQGTQDKNLFLKRYKTCHEALPAGTDQVRFIAVPAPQGLPKPHDELVNLVKSAQSQIRIAAHKITSTPSGNVKLVDALVERLQAGIKVAVVFDDDTILKALQAPGSDALNVSAEELKGYTRLEEAGAEITFVDTNEKLGLLMHNKYVIVDDARLFTGAGNFSSASLLGKNTEQFYIATAPDLVAAYVKGWQELKAWSKEKSYFAVNF